MKPGSGSEKVAKKMSAKKSYSELEAEIVTLTAEVARLKAKAGE